MGYGSWKYPACWFRNIKTFCRGFKYAYQRIVRGFSDYDCFDLDTYYLRNMSATLRHLADTSMGYPINYTPESWAEKLHSMADKMDYILKDNDDDNEYAEGYMEYLENIHFDDHGNSCRSNDRCL